MIPVHCPSERATHEALFDRQVARLIECGYPAALGQTESDFRLWLGMLCNLPQGSLLDVVGKVSPDHIPFLIVVPHGALSITKQMELLVVKKKHGYAGLDGERLWNIDGLGSSEYPYLISDIEDGVANIGVTTADAVTEIRRGCRQGFIAEEGIALATQSPETLIHHAFALADAHYRGESESASPSRRQCVPELWLGSDGPTLNYNWLGSRREDRGVPSCKRRLLLDGGRAL